MKYLVLASLLAAPAFADDATVEGVRFTPTGDGAYTVSVTLSHADTGWEDYADGWRIEARDGMILGERPLGHPHVNEQPFTRATSGVKIPPAMKSVFIRARTNTDGWSETRFEAQVSR